MILGLIIIQIASEKKWYITKYTVYMYALTCSTRPGRGSDDDGGGSTAVPGQVSGTESRHSEPAASPGAGVLQTWIHPETRTGASHGKDLLYTTCKTSA